MPNRYATIAVDYENLKHLFGTLGLTPTSDSHVMYEEVAERFLEVFARHGVRATLFCIAEDVKPEGNRRMLRRFVAAGHEVANHTLTHPFAMRKMPRADKLREIDEARRILEDASGQAVVGYKAPAHDIDAVVIDALEDRGYLYDASVFPSYFNPILNLVYKIVGNDRPLGMGDWQVMLAPNRPYVPGPRYWRPGRRKLVEFPITQLPLVRFPFYSTVMFTLGWASFRASYEILRAKQFLTYVFHSFDLLAADDRGCDASLQRHPSLRWPLATRAAMVDRALATLGRSHRFVTYREAVTTPAIREALVGAA
jgi:peptidoglycan/xylan/chitin deacetylase (PgdA/CDA1 family)